MNTIDSDNQHDDSQLTSPLKGVIAAGDLVILVTADELPNLSDPLLAPHLHILRDVIDQHAITLVTKKSDFADAIGKLCMPPHLVVCDSAILSDIAEMTLKSVALTTFSILMARSKGNFFGLCQRCSRRQHPAVGR